MYLNGVSAVDPASPPPLSTTRTIDTIYGGGGVVRQARRVARATGVASWTPATWALVIGAGALAYWLLSSKSVRGWVIDHVPAND